MSVRLALNRPIHALNLAYMSSIWVAEDVDCSSSPLGTDRCKHRNFGMFTPRLTLTIVHRRRMTREAPHFGRSVRQPEHALGDDVELNLRRAARDRQRL